MYIPYDVRMSDRVGSPTSFKKAMGFIPVDEKEVPHTADYWTWAIPPSLSYKLPVSRPSRREDCRG